MKHLGLLLIHYLMSILFTSAVICQSAFAEGGSSGGGGGSVIQFPNQNEPILLDLLMYHPELVSFQQTSSTKNLSQQDEYPEFESLRDSDQAAFRLARKNLALWTQQLGGKCNIIQEPLLFELVNLVEQSIGKMFYLRTSHILVRNDKVWLPENLKSLNPIITTVIHYDRHFGAFISSPTWDTLSTETQAGLLIHEGMRNIQLQYMAQINEQQLQQITAIIMDTHLIPQYNSKFQDLFGPILMGILGGISKKNSRCPDTIYKQLNELVSNFQLITTVTTTLFPIFDQAQQKTAATLLNYINESDSNKEAVVQRLTDIEAFE